MECVLTLLRRVVRRMQCEAGGSLGSKGDHYISCGEEYIQRSISTNSSGRWRHNYALEGAEGALEKKHRFSGRRVLEAEP